MTREEKKRKELAELGIEYDFAGYAGKTLEGEKTEEPTPKKAAKKGRKSVEGAGVSSFSSLSPCARADHA